MPLEAASFYHGPPPRGKIALAAPRGPGASWDNVIRDPRRTWIATFIIAAWCGWASVSALGVLVICVIYAIDVADNEWSSSAVAACSISTPASFDTWHISRDVRCNADCNDNWAVQLMIRMWWLGTAWPFDKWWPYFPAWGVGGSSGLWYGLSWVYWCTRRKTVGLSTHYRRNTRGGPLNKWLWLVIVALCMSYASAGTVSKPRATLSLHKILEGRGQSIDDDDFSNAGARLGGPLTQYTAADTEDFALKVITANVTAWSAGIQFLRTTNANVVCMQEHKLGHDGIRQANVQCTSAGWLAVWSAALTTDKGGQSGGTAVFVRRGIGIMKVSAGEGMEHRLTAAIIEPPGHPALMIFSAYFCTSIGMKGQNLVLLEDIARVGSMHACPGIIAADFNSAPETVQGTRLATVLEGHIYASCDSTPTCVTSKAKNVIDFFVVYGGLQHAVDKIEVLCDAQIATHRPVQLTFRAKPALLSIQQLKQPQLLDKSALFGPQGPAADYSAVRLAAASALQAACDGQRNLAICHIDRAYKDIAVAFEQELIRNTGTHLKRVVDRARPPAYKWAPTMEKKPEPLIQPDHALNEIIRCAAVTYHVLKEYRIWLMKGVRSDHNQASLDELPSDPHVMPKHVGRPSSSASSSSSSSSSIIHHRHRPSSPSPS